MVDATGVVFVTPPTAPGSPGLTSGHHKWVELQATLDALRRDLDAQQAHIDLLEAQNDTLRRHIHAEEELRHSQTDELLTRVLQLEEERATHDDERKTMREEIKALRAAVSVGSSGRSTAVRPPTNVLVYDGMSRAQAHEFVDGMNKWYSITPQASERQVIICAEMLLTGGPRDWSNSETQEGLALHDNWAAWRAQFLALYGEVNREGTAARAIMAMAGAGATTTKPLRELLTEFKMHWARLPKADREGVLVFDALWSALPSHIQGELARSYTSLEQAEKSVTCLLAALTDVEHGLSHVRDGPECTQLRDATSAPTQTVVVKKSEMTARQAGPTNREAGKGQGRLW